MNWMEAALLILGAGAFIASFIIPEKKGEEEDIGQIDVEVIRKLIDKEMEDAKSRIAEAVDETILSTEDTEQTADEIEEADTVTESEETSAKEKKKRFENLLVLELIISYD